MTIAAMLVVLPAAAADEAVGPAKVRDAVTIAIEGARYRLAGLTVPEARADATAAGLAALIEGQVVTCLKLHRVGHGFFLARCRTAAGEDIAERLLREGLAEVEAGADDVYKAASEEAKRLRKGLWAE